MKFTLPYVFFVLPSDWLTPILSHYVYKHPQVMCRRKEHYEFLMPSVIFNDEASIDPKHRLSDFAYFDRHLMINTLKMSGYDTSAIDIPYHPSPIQGKFKIAS